MKNIDKNQIVPALLLDLTKTFDTIDRTILLDKLERIGFRGPFLRLFRSYFSNRTQKVRFGDDTSDALYFNYGVPERSVLGPMLFIVCVNDLVLLPLKSNIYLYADDTALFLADENYFTAVSTLQEDIKQIKIWFSKNGIFVHNEKTHLMCFRPHQIRVNLTEPVYFHLTIRRQWCCLPLPNVAETKYLGLYFDEFLTWNLHVDYLLKNFRII